MNSKQSKVIEDLVSHLKSGQLTEAGLRNSIANVVTAKSYLQDLLYLHCKTSSPSSGLLGLSLFKGGQEQEISSDPEEWPYKSVLEAIGKGWRVISFPDMSLLTLNDDEFHGLGFLFVLERWSGRDDE